MAQYIVAIDQSTQSTKAFLYDCSGTIVSHASRTHSQLIDEHGWISHDLDEIYHNVRITIKELFSDGRHQPNEVVGIGITNQRETAVAWSRRDGHALSKAVVWQCARARPQCERIQQMHPELIDEIREKTGLPLSPFFPAAKFNWLLEMVPTVSEAAQTGDLCLGTIDSWLLFRLTGGAVFETEPSNASRTQLFNLQKKCWDEELLAIFDIPKSALPVVVASDSCFGWTDCEGVFSRPVPIYGMLGDSQAALFGQGARQRGDVKVTYGTGSSVMVNVGDRQIRSHSGLVSSVGWQVGNQWRYVLEGNVNYAGALISWLRDGLGILASPEQAQSLAEEANPQDQTVIVPAFTGLGAPYWDANARAAIVNMTATTKKPEIVKAALDAIVFQVDAIIVAMREDGVPLADNITVDGGPTSNAYLMQTQSDISALTVRIADVEDISAFGVALLVGIHLKVFDDKGTYLRYQNLQPHLSTTERASRIGLWQTAVKTVILHEED